jgi:tRNA threonylcarbamoyladenosine biosynthesis protein TsaB
LAEERYRPLAREDWLLALETAAGAASAALYRAGELRGEERIPRERSAAAELLPAIDRLLRAAGIGPAELRAFAVSIGPGSFTGLRIGVATVKGLAFASEAPVAPVPTLAALARAAGRAEGPVVALLDARRGEVYGAAYRNAGEEPWPGLPAGVYTPAQLGARLPARARLVGEGAAIVQPQLARPGLAFEPAVACSAAQVAALGAQLLARGVCVSARELVPRYLRRAEAEVRRTGERFEAPEAGAETRGPHGECFDGPDSLP